MKLICEMVEDIFSLVVPVRREIYSRRVAMFSEIVQAWASGEVVMMIVPIWENLI